jgi:cysteine synthase A
MVQKARELAETHGWFLTRQFENESNADMHSRTTAPEILDAFDGMQLDYWVTGYGTGGTLKGVARVLRERSPDTKVIVCEPEVAGLLTGGVPQKRNADGSPAESHPSFSPHPMQGWTPDFIPKLAGDSIDAETVDKIVTVANPRAMECSRNLAQQEGIFVGISAGATLAAALEIAESAAEGSNILAMLPDTGERYLTTPLFEGIEAEMSAGEQELSASTPGCQFEAS